MIALLSCSTNLLISSVAANSSTGGLKQDSITHDSILVSYDDLRKANSKLIELEYEKDINERLRAVINNDSIAIHNLKCGIDGIRKDCDRRVKRAKKERNVAGGIGIVAIILLVISIL